MKFFRLRQSSLGVRTFLLGRLQYIVVMSNHDLTLELLVTMSVVLVLVLQKWLA